MNRISLPDNWNKIWDEHVRSAQEEGPEIMQEAIQHLEHFISHGNTGVPPMSGAPPDERPGWDQRLYAPLIRYGVWLGISFEESAVERHNFSVELASRAFAAGYTSLVLVSRTHAMFPHRFSGRTLSTMSMREVVFAALGVVIGAYDKAFELARLQLNAFRNRHYFDRDSYPIFGFLLQLMADHLGERCDDVSTLARAEPVLAALLDKWRDPDPDSLTELCANACDLHARSCEATTQREFAEFDNGIWMRTPIEILLLFKLRQLNGLTNPEVDHPLMIKPFRTLPADVGFAPDGLIARVRSRMTQDGYDEDAIIGMVLKSTQV